MKRRHLLLLALLSSCGPTQELPPPLPGTMEPLLVSDAGVTAAPDAGPVAQADGGAPPMTGFPCDVRAVVETHCSGCHIGGMYVRSLLTRATFLEQRVNSTQLLGELALQRMQPNSAAPMPPYGYITAPTAAEVAVISNWVNAGMPAGACGDAVPK